MRSEIESFHIRFKHIRNSLKYYNKSSFEDYDRSVKEMSITEKQYEEFINKLNAGFLIIVKDDVDSMQTPLVEAAKEFIVLCKELEINLNSFESFEREVKILCMKDWHKNLTPFNFGIDKSCV